MTRKNCLDLGDNALERLGTGIGDRPESSFYTQSKPGLKMTSRLGGLLVIFLLSRKIESRDASVTTLQL